MAEALTFENFSPGQAELKSIFAIGANEDLPNGLIHEMASVFDVEISPVPDVDNIGSLIAAVGPKPELQENIEQVHAALGRSGGAISILQNWANRSGLLIPVNRFFMHDVSAKTEAVDTVVIKGAIRNWMARREIRLTEYQIGRNISRAILLGGNRVMKAAEGDDVIEGMLEADYMDTVLKPKIELFGIETTVIKIDKNNGELIIEEGIAEAKDEHGIDLSDSRIAVISNAGAWVQDAGQVRRGMQATYGKDYDRDGDQLVVVSDTFPLGDGTQSPKDAQNPKTFAGIIPRSAQELVRHMVSIQ